MRAVSEYLKKSIYSDVSVFYAASLPEAVSFQPGNTFDEITKQSLTLKWLKPAVTSEMLPVTAYKVYWDEGYLLEENYVLLETIAAYD